MIRSAHSHAADPVVPPVPRARSARRRGRSRAVVCALHRPVDSASLVAFRVAFGALMLIAVGRHLAYGWVDALYLVPRVHFPYPGLEWITPLPAAAMYALYAALALAAVGIVLGAWTRLNAAFFCLGFTYVHLIDRTTYLNHYYLVSLLAGWLVLLPARGEWSLDGRRHPRLRHATVPAWAVWILRFQLGVVYVFGAVAKLNPDWLLRAEPLRIWLGANVDLPLLGPWLEASSVAYAFSYAGLLFDAAVVPALLWQRTRPFAYGAVLIFHVLTALLFPIGMFPWLMIALTPIFFAPDWPRRIPPRRTAPGASTAPAALSSAPTTAQVGLATALAAYALIQVAVPLRHLTLPGDLYWSESGFRWAWQIMVMEKHGRAAFSVTGRTSGTTWPVIAADELTPMQVRMMATQPDMILSYAHHLAEVFARREAEPVEVHADVFVALNGRPHARLVDPAVDLAALSSTADPHTWLLPHPDAPGRIAGL